MVKKQLRSGEACKKCLQTEDMLRQRGLCDRIDEVVWALEDDPSSPGMVLAQRFGVDVAPFFLVTGDDGQVSAIRSALQLIREHLQAGGGRPGSGNGAFGRAPSSGEASLDLAAAAVELAGAEPERVIRWGLERFGADLVFAFSGS